MHYVHEQIAERIRSRIKSGHYPPASKLPSVARMARDEKVSLVTMWKALSLLANEGLIRGKRGSRYAVIGQEHDEKDTVNTDSEETIGSLRWLRIKRQIIKAIADGVFPPATSLPSNKELCNRFGVAYPTLKKALGSLEEDGLVLTAKRGYTVSLPAPRKSGSNNIVVIGPAHAGTTRMFGFFSEEFIRYLEVYGSKTNLRPRFLYVQIDPPLPQYFEQGTGKPIELAEIENALGIIYLANDLANHEFVLRSLAHKDQPIAIVDLVGGWELPGYLKIKAGVKRYVVAAEENAPVMVARHLWSLGHRRIAYLSAYQGALWSQYRLLALQQAWSRLGNDGALFPFTFSELQNDLEYFKASNARYPARPLIEAGLDWKKEAPMAYIGAYHRFFELEFEQRFANCEFYYQVLHLCSQAAENQSVTAWVAANDRTACIALEYLRKNGLEVPGRISVIGFDDTRMALLDNLTSYNFNIQSIMYAVVKHIVSFKRTVHGSKAVVINIAGTIIERNSTGPAPSN